MSKTANSTTSAGASPKRAVSKEMSLSLFESALSYMLEAGYKILAEQKQDEGGQVFTNLAIVGIGYGVGEDGKTEFYQVPIMATRDTIIGTLEKTGV